LQRCAWILLATVAPQSGAGCLDYQYAQAVVDAFTEPAFMGRRVFA
jgi:hypothetical protein